MHGVVILAAFHNPALSVSNYVTAIYYYMYSVTTPGCCDNKPILIQAIANENICGRHFFKKKTKISRSFPKNNSLKPSGQYMSHLPGHSETLHFARSVSYDLMPIIPLSLNWFTLLSPCTVI